MVRFGEQQPETHPYSMIVHKPDPDIEYYEAYKNIGRKYTILKRGADASTVIQSAINALTSGGRIFIKAGTYPILLTGDSWTIILKQKVEICGEGIDKTVLQYSGTLSVPSYMLQMHASSRLSGLTIDVNGANLTYGTYPASSYFGGVCMGDEPTADIAGDYAMCERVKVMNAKPTGGVLNLESAGLNMFCGAGMTVKNIIFDNCNDGLFITYPSSVVADSLHFRFASGIYGKDCDALIYWEVGSGILRAVRGVDCGRLLFVRSPAGSITKGIIDDLQGYNLSTNAITLGSSDVVEDFVIVNAHLDTVAGHGIITNGNITLMNPVIRNVAGGHVGIWAQSGILKVKGGHITGTVSVEPAASVHFDDVIGFVTENSRTATILSGQTSVTFAHGLAGAPTLVTLGATHAEVSDAIWSADATNITITVPSAVTANRSISWYAEYKP